MHAPFNRFGRIKGWSVVLVGLLGCGGVFAGATDEPAALSKEQRTRLEKQATELKHKAVALYQGGR